MIVDHDVQMDVLYVRRDDARIFASESSKNDWGLILGRNAEGTIVGVTWIEAKGLASHWPKHPDRAAVPEDILRAIDEWYEKT
jgi:hypothetical protein